jgi:hypothetical protein
MKKLIVFALLLFWLSACTIRCLEGMCPPDSRRCRPVVVCCVMPQGICVKMERPVPPPTLVIPTWTPTPVR